MSKKKVHKSQLKIPEKSSAQGSRPKKKHGKKGIAFKSVKADKGWMIAGFDTSMSSIAGAAIAYDGILKKFKGPVFSMERWSMEDHYFDRLKFCAKSHEILLDLQGQLLLSLPYEKVFIAQEEPWPFGMVKGGDSGWLKQQAEISGAFLGGLIRYGFSNVSQMNTARWRKVVADDLGITTHHSKWKDQNLPKGWLKQIDANVIASEVGKFRAKYWALTRLGAELDTGLGMEGEIPDWPDIIKSNTLGKIPRPEDSKAKAIQPDDRYDALAVMWTHYLELGEDGILDK